MLSTLIALALAATPTDTLVVGLLSDPVSLEPHRATGLDSAAIVVNVCEPLVRERPDGNRAEPVLATTWATMDNRTWTFTLREGVRFHDGTPLDADAVVANLELLRRERAFPGAATRIGPLVVAIALDRPNAALLATLSQPFFALQSPRRLGEKSNGTPVGTGPFKLRSQRPGRVELEAHREHWSGSPRLTRLVFERLPSPEALVRAVVAGQVDVTSALSQHHTAEVARRPEIVLETRTGLTTTFLSLNNERAPFDDRRVRQAIARAFDREALVKTTLDGHGQPARNPLPPCIWGYAPRTKELLLDQRGARRLLAEAGLRDGFETTLMVAEAPRPYLPAPLQVAKQVQHDLAEVGIRARVVRVHTRAEFVARSRSGDYDLAVMGWQADTLDPNDFLSVLLASESIGTTNRSRYRSPAMDALLKRGRMGSQPAERLAAYVEAQELFQRDMPWVPLYHVAAFTVRHHSVQELRVGPTGLLRYERVWKKDE
jgi:peptide/nickel transport system substrate-binding protein